MSGKAIRSQDWKKPYLDEIETHNQNAHDEWMRVRRLLRAKNHKVASEAIDKLVFLLNECLGPAVSDLAVKEDLVKDRIEKQLEKVKK